MKFCDMPYKRITFEEMEQRYLTMIADLENAKSGEDCMAVIRERYKLYNDMTPMQICYVRHDMNVNDAFYAAEQAYYDEIGPKLSDLYNRMSGLLLASPYRPYLENILGKQAFSIMAEAKIGFDARLIPLAQEENTLTARYNVLTSNGTVQWNGKELKRSLMTPYTQSPEREVRRQAALAVSASWEAERDELEDIFSRLVDNRNRQAKLLGFSDYAKLSFHTMYRIGYGQAEVATFREQVKRYIVPLWVQSEKKRMERLHLSHLYSYDGGISFPEGNPVPAGDTAACLAMTREMYTKMSPETAEFISCLLDNELYDVEIRDGKRGGGYMTFFESYRLPFIFANFDGTSENAYIMCHEGGHAFQGYLKRNEEIRERCSVTSETAETHAMSMEFFTYPYMELFFGERAKDYRQMHLEDALRLICSECLQDEFQQLVYEQPNLTPAQRNDLWHRLEQEYFPGKDHSGNENLLSGCGWQRIPHVFLWPFYAIDYALAEICALEYYQWANTDFSAAWKSYLNFCKESGSENFHQLILHAGLGDPFADGTLESLGEWLKEQITK